MGRRSKLDALADIGDGGDSQTIGDEHIHISADGTRVIAHLHNPQPVKRHRITELAEVDERLEGWTPVNAGDIQTARAIADTVSSYEMAPDVELLGNKEKRPYYQSSDDPMSVWLPEASVFLDELLRREGLTKHHCSLCSKDDDRLFRCNSCGAYAQCQTCVLERHRLTPLHRVMRWNGKFWDDALLHRPIAQNGLGLEVQLGHDGLPCRNPSAPRSMVVIHTNGVFSLTVRLCACELGQQRSDPVQQLLAYGWYPATTVQPATCATLEALELFRLLNVVGNINAHDYMGVMERLTDAANVGKTPDRYKALLRMTRQHAYLIRAKRMGRGHETNGLQLTAVGGLAVVCWACPDDKRNLPTGWRNVRKKDAYLYKLILALDANFRLKNRLRANEHSDPSLTRGQGYFVQSDGYKSHLKTYVKEKDISSCVAFAALLQKDTRLTTGLRVSGVGGCVCARHGLVRRQGLGDLQKGERFANMDFIALATLENETAQSVLFSYDIACQWKVLLPLRARRLKDSGLLTTDLDDFEIQYALPVWHASAHEITCQVANSLRYAVGVGKTDGEGIERTWSILNPVGWSTKEMGEGSRHDAIEDKIDHVNFEKNIGQGEKYTCSETLIVAIAESSKQDEEFREIDGNISPETRKAWQAKLDAWKRDDAQPNPYVIEGGQQAGPSQKDILNELKAAELADARAGNVPLLEGTMTAAAFIEAGLQLEESQLVYDPITSADPLTIIRRKIIADTKNTTLLTANRSSQIQESRFSLFNKYKTFARHEARAAAKEEGTVNAENIRLYLPSQLTAEQRKQACLRAATNAEAKLWLGQCADALAALRGSLHTQAHVIYWRNANAVGQKSSTRSATLISRIGQQVERKAAKYRDAQAALVALKGASYAPQFRKLEPGDVNHRPGVENDVVSMKHLASADSTRASRNEPTTTAIQGKVSWIWSAGAGAGAGELHDSVRVDWSKAKARRERWREEIGLLREEMKRVLRSLRWEQEQWQRRASGRDDEELTVELKSGLQAYALRQSELHKRIGAQFFAGWDKPITGAVRDVMNDDSTLFRQLLEGTALSALDVDEPELTAVQLPSWRIKHRQRSEFSTDPQDIMLRNTEIKLRCSQAENGILAVQAASLALSATKKARELDYRGQGGMTRSQRNEQKGNLVKDHEIGIYNCAREALVSLGHIKRDSDKPFPPLTRRDTRRKETHLHRAKGDSRLFDGTAWYLQSGTKPLVPIIGQQVLAAGGDSDDEPQLLTGTQSLKRSGFHKSPRPAKRVKDIMPADSSEEDMSDTPCDSDGTGTDQAPSKRRQKKKKKKGKKGDGWIWMDGWVKGRMGDGSKLAEYKQEADRVQYLRAEAEMYRWLEQYERKHAELWRVIERFGRDAAVWDGLAEHAEARDGGMSGAVSFARMQAAMSKRLQHNARATFRNADLGAHHDWVCATSFDDLVSRIDHWREVVFKWMDDMGIHHFLCFSWDLRTISSRPTIAAFLTENARFTNAGVHDMALLTTSSIGPPAVFALPNGGEGVSGVFAFALSSPSAIGRACFRLIRDAEDGVWRAHTLFMNMEELVGHEERAPQEAYREETWQEAHEKARCGDRAGPHGAHRGRWTGGVDVCRAFWEDGYSYSGHREDGETGNRCRSTASVSATAPPVACIAQLVANTASPVAAAHYCAYRPSPCPLAAALLRILRHPLTASTSLL
ncbi:CxC2 domain-containing protein [Mycena indigotica]|uniref:CxC2 domain-containing protein n=1 Tax=Mycena indigotica TaxID=2126181 RepID=A0A8H6WBE2_9AGAR|nr:CxC2 domain-containing protein [Mycena indigotica]KAF7310141.1 CxC2 domain-containing protein [Mycena indigotica]